MTEHKSSPFDPWKEEDSFRLGDAIRLTETEGNVQLYGREYQGRKMASSVRQSG
jgi:hypothetical protein